MAYCDAGADAAFGREIDVVQLRRLA
jgi:hypothetical protein